MVEVFEFSFVEGESELLWILVSMVDGVSKRFRFDAEIIFKELFAFDFFSSDKVVKPEVNKS